jgi:hypothetical protein
MEQDARRAELGQFFRPLGENLGLAGLAGAVDEPGLEVAPGALDRLARTRGGSRRRSAGRAARKTSIPLSAAEATNRRAKSPPTGCEPTRNRPRSAIPSGVLVRDLSARIRSHGLSTPARPPCRRPAPGHLQVGEAGPVENLREVEQRGGRDPPGERLLAQQADRRIGEGRHAGTLPPVLRPATSA